MNETIKNVAIYCRVSTEEQKKFGISVDDQRNSLTNYCKHNKYKIYDYYIDEGVSAGTISKRKEFVRLLKDLDNIDLIIFTKLDRFSRNVRDANNLLVELDKHNTSFRAIDEDDIDTSTADGRFIFNLKVNLAEHERNKDSERINRVNKYKFHTAMTVCSGTKIFGYNIDENKKLVINEKEAKQLNDLYDVYIETNNLSETTKWFQNNVKIIGKETVKRYLKNTAYIGKYKHIIEKTKEIEFIDGFSPQIIPIDKFNKVQSLFNKNIKEYKRTNSEYGNKTDYIFSGLLKCSCGCKMAGKNSKQKHYYSCKKSRSLLQCNNKTNIAEKKIEDYLIENIDTILKKEIKKYEIQSLERNKKSINKDTDKSVIKKKLNKLSELYVNEMIDMDYYKKEYSMLQEKLKSIEEQEKDIEIIDYSKILDIINSDWLTIYRALENKQKREFWATLIDFILINGKEDFDIKFNC